LVGKDEAARNSAQCVLLAVLVCVPCGCGPACGGRAAKPEPAGDAGPAVPRGDALIKYGSIRQWVGLDSMT
jgi:hypothetical protein